MNELCYFCGGSLPEYPYLGISGKPYCNQDCARGADDCSIVDADSPSVFAKGAESSG